MKAFLISAERAKSDSRYVKMTEFEYIEAYRNSLELIGTANMGFVTMLFAYVVVAYIVGKSLNRVPGISQQSLF